MTSEPAGSATDTMFAVPDWRPPAAPPRDLALEGRYVRLDPFAADRHAGPVHARAAAHPDLWDYMPGGPFDSATAYGDYVEATGAGGDPQFFALFSKDLGAYAGHASYLRINPEQGSIELGHILLTPELQRSRAATEAWRLMMGWAFDAGYRRFEWKCNAANARSRRAAQRLGFAYEGTHRQTMVIKGRNRDTAWYSILDREWPERRQRLDGWLRPENFDASGHQRQALTEL